jgi:probable RNA-binding protein EIF1AD
MSGVPVTSAATPLTPLTPPKQTITKHINTVPPPYNAELSTPIHNLLPPVIHAKMPPPKRQLLATVESTLTPPDVLTKGQTIARVTTGAGNNLFNAELPGGKTVLVELEPRFRNTIYIKRGSYVLVDSNTLAERENKIDGEIVNVVRDEKMWRKMGYWYV